MRARDLVCTAGVRPRKEISAVILASNTFVVLCNARQKPEQQRWTKTGMMIRSCKIYYRDCTQHGTALRRKSEIVDPPLPLAPSFTADAEHHGSISEFQHTNSL